MHTLKNPDLLRTIVDICFTILQYMLIPFIVYHFIISAFGWFKRKEKPADEYAPSHDFAIVIAAHNEEIVIGNIVRNLRKLDYPADRYDIYVIADNCSDRTAEIAKNNGAIVYERYDDAGKSKGFALKWMFDKLFGIKKQYDAICVFDADNLVSSNYLREMNKQLCLGHKVIQGYLDSKNPLDSMISGSYSIAYWISNRLFQLPRNYLGLCCQIGGTGFTVAVDVLKQVGWDSTCLTEDLEFTLKLVLKGYKVKWSHEAIVYDEKPIKISQSWKQRKRWMQGHSYCAGRYLGSLLKKAWRDKDLTAFDIALYLLQPFIIVASGAGMLFNLLRMVLFADLSQGFGLKTFVTFLVSFLLTYWTVIFIYAEGKLSTKIFWYYLVFPLYNLTWIPIIIQGYIDRNKKDWAHTLHTRSLDLSDLERLGRTG